MRVAIFLTSQSRMREVGEFLQALVSGEHQNFRVWFLAQEGFDLSAPGLDLLSDPRIEVVKGPKSSLSAARNMLIPKLDGDLVWFADDDCRPLPDTLRFVVDKFRERPDIDILSVRSVDETGVPSMSRTPAKPCEIAIGNVWRTAISYTMFFSRDAVARIGLFDERLGVGAPTPWQSGEETDYLMRGMGLGMNAWFDSAAAVIHPDKSKSRDASAIKRFKAYARGAAMVIYKHQLGWLYVLKLLYTTLLGSAYLAVTGRAAETPHRLITAAHRTREYARLRIHGPEACLARPV